MREIVISTRKPGAAAPIKKSRITILGHGETGTGKTAFMATMPRLLVLAVGDEGGWTTIQTMDPQLYHDPNRVPMVWAIDSVGDLGLALQKAAPLIASGQIESIGFDSVTFYADLWLATTKASNPGIDNRQLYGGLGDHLRDVRVRVHQLGQNLNVMWTALTTTPDRDDAADRARPMIPGAQGDKFAAGVDFLFYFAIKTLPPAPGKPAAQKFEIRTRRHGRALARGRDSGVLPDPLGFRTFRELRQRLESGALSSVPPPPTDAELQAGEAAAANESSASATPAQERSSAPARNPASVSPGPVRRTFKAPT